MFNLLWSHPELLAWHFSGNICWSLKGPQRVDVFTHSVLLVNLVMPEINEVHNVVVLERERERRTSSKKEEDKMQQICTQYKEHSA